MVDKAVKDKKEKKPEEPVTIEEEDLFEDFPASKGDMRKLHLCQHELALACRCHGAALQPAKALQKYGTSPLKSYKAHDVRLCRLQAAVAFRRENGRRRQSCLYGKQTGMMRTLAATLCSI